MTLSVCVYFEVPQENFCACHSFYISPSLQYLSKLEPIQTYLSDVLMGRWKPNILYSPLCFLHFRLQQHESASGLLLCSVHFAGQTED